MFGLSALMGVLLLAIGSVVGRSTPMRRRAATIAPIHETRRGSRSPRTLDIEARTFEIQFASETPVAMFDFELECQVAEVLLTNGGEPEENVRLLEQHKRGTGSLVGSVRDPHIEADVWVGTAEVARTARGDELLNMVVDGHLTDVSVGYLVLERELVESGGWKFVAGREWHNTYAMPLSVVTRWRIVEVSLVDIGADGTAKIRSHNVVEGKEERSMSVGIHSRQSVTGRLSTREVVASLLLRHDVDPSRHLATATAGSVMPISGHEAVRAAEVADRFRQFSPCSLVKTLLEADRVQIHDHSPQGIARCLYLQQRSGGWGGTSVAQAFDSVAASMINAGRDEVGDTASLWVDDVDVPNYLMWPSLRLASAELHAVPRGGAAENLDIEVVGQNARVARYGAKVLIDEIDLTNFLSAGAELLPALVFRALGQASMSLELNLPFALLQSQPTMHDGLPLFHADHLNAFTGYMDDDGLSEAAAGIANQERPEGVKLNLRAEVVLVPPEMERDARKRVREIELAGDRSSPTPAVLGESRLTGMKDPATGATIAGSPSTFYLAAIRGGYGLQRQFLAGTNRKPLMRSGRAAASGEWGMSFDLQHSVGCEAIGWEGLAVVEAPEET